MMHPCALLKRFPDHPKSQILSQEPTSTKQHDMKLEEASKLVITIDSLWKFNDAKTGPEEPPVSHNATDCDKHTTDCIWPVMHVDELDQSIDVTKKFISWPQLLVCPLLILRWKLSIHTSWLPRIFTHESLWDPFNLHSVSCVLQSEVDPTLHCENHKFFMQMMTVSLWLHGRFNGSWSFHTLTQGIVNHISQMSFLKGQQSVSQPINVWTDALWYKKKMQWYIVKYTVHALQNKMITF